VRPCCRGARAEFPAPPRTKAAHPRMAHGGYDRRRSLYQTDGAGGQRRGQGRPNILCVELVRLGRPPHAGAGIQNESCQEGGRRCRAGGQRRGVRDRYRSRRRWGCGTRRCAERRHGHVHPPDDGLPRVRESCNLCVLAVGFLPRPRRRRLLDRDRLHAARLPLLRRDHADFGGLRRPDCRNRCDATLHERVHSGWRRCAGYGSRRGRRELAQGGRLARRSAPATSASPHTVQRPAPRNPAPALP